MTDRRPRRRDASRIEPDSRPRLHLVVAGVIVEDERILIAQRLPGGRIGNRWEFPGGKLEWGESPEAGLRREIREELNLEVRVGAVLDAIHYALDESTAFAVLFYWCRVVGGALELKGCQDTRWITVEELSTSDFLESNLPVVHMLEDRVRALGTLSPVFPNLSHSR